MNISSTDPQDDGPAAQFRRLTDREGLILIWILLTAVSFNFVNFYPEMTVDVIDLNDSGMP